MGLEDIKLAKGQIERLEGNQYLKEKGYRFKGEELPICDVYWRKISGHYLIQRESRNRGPTGKFGHMYGPFPLEILESNISEQSADQRCLEILIEYIRKAHPNALLENSTAHN